jgi:hypothetical protein
MKVVGHVTDLLSLGNELIDLINSHELQAAAARVREAERTQIRVSVGVRSLQIAEIIRSLSSAKALCERLRSAVEKLPPAERLFARVQVEEVIDRHFTSEMHELRRRKQELSKPG